MAMRSVRRRGDADNVRGPTRSGATIGTRRANLHGGPEPVRSTPEAGYTTAADRRRVRSIRTDPAALDTREESIYNR